MQSFFFFLIQKQIENILIDKKMKENLQTLTTDLIYEVNVNTKLEPDAHRKVIFFFFFKSH